MVERRVPQPLLPLALLRSLQLLLASLAAFTLTATTSAAGVINTLYLQRVLELTPTTTGALLIITSLAVIAGSVLGSPLSAWLGFRWAMILGLTGIALALLVYTLASASSGLLYVMVGLAVSGLGLGCASLASTAAALADSAAESQGVVSGFVNTAAQLGTALGIVGFVTLATVRTDMLTGKVPEGVALLAGYRWAFGGAALFALATSLLLACLRLESKETAL